MEKFIVLKITWDELETLGCPSVTDYCRVLVKDKKTPLPDRIEVYRRDMLCLTVNDVKAASELQPLSTGGFGKYNPPPSKRIKRAK